MKIQLYDRGSPQGKKLFEEIENLCKRLSIDYDPEFITDMHRPYSMGIQGKTVMLIDGEVALIDKYPSQKELETIIVEYLK